MSLHESPLDRGGIADVSNACAQGGRPSPVSAMSCDSELGKSAGTYMGYAFGRLLMYLPARGTNMARVVPVPYDAKYC